MKKFGFTMAELLVTLAVIAVVAATTAPMLSGLAPDKNKAKVLKVYKTVSDVNESILNNPSLYAYATFTTNNGSYECSGLNCITEPRDPNYKKFGNVFNNCDNNMNNLSCDGFRKYPCLLFSNLNTNNDDSIALNNAQMELGFTTTDNIHWLVKDDGAVRVDDGIQEITITIDTEPDGGSNCHYSANCSKPDRFILRVNNNGTVTWDPSDPLTRAYLANPTKLNDKKADYAKAKAWLP